MPAVNSEVRVLEDLEVLGDGRPADRDGRRDLHDRQGARHEQLEDRAAARIGEGLEGGHLVRRHEP
jgi:hypothetical protein